MQTAFITLWPIKKERKENENFEANIFILLAFKAIISKNVCMVVLR